MAINIRKMNKSDLETFKKWLYKPHVAKWYHEPESWIEEAEKSDSEFNWISHCIVEIKGKSIGFCQYYACEDSDEDWAGYTKLGGTYSIDYMIGETEFLSKGYGKEIVRKLEEKIKYHHDAKRIVVQPEKDNKASRGVLLSSGYLLDDKKDIFVKVI